jgi:hypothetical protein
LVRKKVELKYHASELDAQTQGLSAINHGLKAKIEKRGVAKQTNRTTEQFPTTLG